MRLIRKRKLPNGRESDTWYTAFKVGGSAKSLGTADEKLAEEIAAELYAKVMRAKAGVVRDEDRPKHDLEELSKQWVKRKRHKETINEDIFKIGVISEIWGNPYINDIDTAVLDVLVEGLQKRKIKPGTINRYLALVRGMLRMANRQLFDRFGGKRLPWTDLVPAMPTLREPRRKVVKQHPRVFWDIYQGLCEIGHETHANAALVALVSGLRDENVFDLEKSRVDEKEKSVWVWDSKNGEPIAVPVPDIAMAAIQKEMAKHPDHPLVFVAPKGGRIYQGSSKAFRRVVEGLGLKGQINWHALRHLFAKVHKMTKTPKHVIQSLGAWETSQMVDRYGFVDSLHYREHADNAAEYLSSLRANGEQEGGASDKGEVIH